MESAGSGATWPEPVKRSSAGTREAKPGTEKQDLFLMRRPPSLLAGPGAARPSMPRFPSAPFWVYGFQIQSRCLRGNPLGLHPLTACDIDRPSPEATARQAPLRIRIGPIEAFKSEPDWHSTPVVDINSATTCADEYFAIASRLSTYTIKTVFGRPISASE